MRAHTLFPRDVIGSEQKFFWGINKAPPTRSPSIGTRLIWKGEVNQIYLSPNDRVLWNYFFSFSFREKALHFSKPSHMKSSVVVLLEIWKKSLKCCLFYYYISIKRITKYRKSFANIIVVLIEFLQELLGTSSNGGNSADGKGRMMENWIGEMTLLFLLVARMQCESI